MVVLPHVGEWLLTQCPLSRVAGVSDFFIDLVRGHTDRPCGDK